MNVVVDETLLVARPIDGGFTWTLASRLGDFLAQAERQLGPRNRTFTILGVEFREGVPKVWFPGNCGHVIVQLGVSAMQDSNRALFQLAHECVHLLDPSPGGTNKLEEGLATHFALEVMQSLGVNYSTGDPKYDAACALVGEMLTGLPDAGRELRARYGPWKFITAQQIGEECSRILPELAQDLASAF